MMGEEKEPVEVGTGLEAAKDSVRSVKLSQGLLSFRSRKLLRNSLSKGSGANNVDKRATVLPAAEVSNLERSKIRSKQSHGEPTKADPRKVENETAKAKTRSSTRQDKKLERIPPIKDEQVKDGDGLVEKPATQQLSPKFKLLETFYEGLEAACSLLRIRKQMCTFRAVCKIVESISKRRFLLKHLAQIKHIFAEVVQLEYVRCQDPDSWGDRWDLRVTLLALPSDSPHTSSLLKGSPGQKAQTIRRRKEFHARLLCLSGSQPEDGDIPLGPLPQRPLGGDLLQSSSTQPAASPPSDRVSDSNPSAQVGISGASTEPANSQPHTQIGTEELGFSIVKPSRGDDTVPVSGTPHFLPSFRPFYSNTQTTEKVDQVSGTLPYESHFSASFRPSFTTRRTFEATDGLPLETPKKVLPDEIVLRGSCLEDEAEKSGVESPISAKNDVSCSISVNSSTLSDKGFHFPPFTPVSSANSEKLPPNSVDRSCHSTPSKTVPSANPMEEVPPESVDRSCSSTPSKTVPSADRGEVPPKGIDMSCHSTPSTPVPSADRRELPPKRIDISSSTPCTPVPSDDAKELPPQSIDKSCHLTPSIPVPSAGPRELQSSSTENSFRFLPSTPLPSSSTEKSCRSSPSTPVPSANSVELPFCSNDKVCPQRQMSAPPGSPITIHTPPFLSPMKRVHPSTQNPSNETSCKMSLNNSVSPIPRSQGTMRSLRFASPTRGPQLKAEETHTPPKIHSLRTGVETPPSSSARVVHTSGSTPSTPSPETPDLQNSVRTTQSKEVWYSPPKRLKLRASLFANDRETSQEKCSSGNSISGARESCPEAVGGGLTGEVFSDSPQQEASKGLKPRSIANDNKGITESDLEVIQSLPQDIVQSVWEKERKMKDTSTRELAKQKRRQQMMSGVPKLFNQLRLIFQSLNRTVLPEHELMKTILTSHPEITDKVEVEERLKLVIELAPDYIHTRPSHSGELLYRVDKRADVVQIQRRLSETSN